MFDMWRRFQSFLTDRKGGMAIAYGLAAIPLMMGAGVAVDTGRAYVVRQRLFGALDAAGLAVGSSTGTTAQLQTLMQSYFNANYPAEALGVPATPTMVINNDVITLSATADLPTSFMRIAGINTVDVAADVTIIKETKGVEVALVLDVTGSMGATNMAALRTAASDLVNIIFRGENFPQYLKVALVPYSAAVNVGSIAPSIVDPASPYASRYNPASSTSWAGCVQARPYPLDVQDVDFTGANVTQPFWVAGTSSENRWNDPTPSVTYDNSWPAPVTNYTQCNNMTGPNIGCPRDNPILPLTNDRATILNRISQLVYWCRGGTFGNEGMAWGWRVLSPEAPFTEGAAWTDTRYNKVVVMMTDGVNQWFTNSGSTETSDYSAYRRIGENLLGTTNNSTATTLINSRQTEVCTAMKARGIIIYTITFNLSNTTTQNLYRACATDPSKYYNSPSTTALQNAFRSIGAELSNLRIAH